MPTPSLPAGLSKRTRLVAVALAILLQAMLLWIYYQPEPKGLVGDEIDYVRTARAIQQDEEGRIEPFRPPLYPVVLATLGVRAQNRWPVQLLQLALLIVAALAVRSLGLHLFEAPRAGDLAALGMLLYPTLGAFSHYLWPEILHLALWVGVVWILATRKKTPGWLALAGLLLATAILTRHLLLLFLPAVAVALWLASATGRVRRLAWFLAPIALILTSAMWIDWHADGRLLSASSARFNLWVGLNDQSRKSLEQPIAYGEYETYLASAETPAERDRILAEKTRALVAHEGWLSVLGGQLGRQYFRLFDKDSFLTEQLPGGAMHGTAFMFMKEPEGEPPSRLPTAVRLGYRATPGAFSGLMGPFAASLRIANYIIYAALLALTTWGIAASRPGSSRWLQLILAFLVYNLAIFLVLHVKSRYRLQLAPFLFLFAGLGLDRLTSEGWTPPSGREWAALGAAALLLFLAFGGPFL